MRDCVCEARALVLEIAVESADLGGAVLLLGAWEKGCECLQGDQGGERCRGKEEGG